MEEQQSTRANWSRPPTAYSQWRQMEEVPVYQGSHVENLHEAEVAPWPRIGQKGALINLAAQEQNDGWLVEIAPGGKTEVLKHLFEATYYIEIGRAHV